MNVSKVNSITRLHQQQQERLLDASIILQIYISISESQINVEVKLGIR